jgi:hypothetical protein
MRRRLLLVLPVLGLVIYGGTAASASVTQPRISTGHNCVARATPLGSSRAPTFSCYATFAQAVNAATGGRVRLPASATPRSTTPDEINARTDAPNTTYVLSIDWTSTNYGGNSLTWTQTSKCGSFQASSMPSGWNDAVKSVAAYSGCANTLFQNNNFGGSTYKIRKDGSSSNLGSFNDQASSETWCPTYPCGG